MKFVDVEFGKIYFVLTREDSQKVSFPYSKIDFIIADENACRLRLEVRKQGSFFGDYSTLEKMKNHHKLLMNKGRATV